MDIEDIKQALCATYSVILHQRATISRNVRDMQLRLGPRETLENVGDQAAPDRTPRGGTHHLYRRIAKECHPDRGGDPDMLKGIGREATLCELVHFAIKNGLCVAIADEEWAAVSQELKELTATVGELARNPFFRWDTMTETEKDGLLEALRSS